jgi:molybdate transport system substrate-binding protein
VKNRILAGEVPDVTITQGSFIDDLLKQNKIMRGTVANLALSTVVAFVRSGAPKPDISFIDALKRTLFAARSIAYSDPAKGGAAGVYFTASMERLGIADQLKPKVKLVAPGASGETVGKGEAEIGIDQNAVVRPIPGIDIIGPLPRDLKADIMFSAGVVSGAREQAGAAALIKFLSSPTAVSAIKAAGLEPASP